MQLFYTPNPEFLSAEETNHAKNVLRLKEGSKIKTFDGKGFFYDSEIVSFTKLDTKLSVISKNEQIKNGKFNLEIAICPTKNSDRIEWFVEKAIEIGVHKISFIQTSRTERKNINLERIQKVAISAAKQSLKATLPEVTDLLKFEKFINSDFSNTIKYVAHLEDDNRKSFFEELQNIETQNIVILIGPEGDFTSIEIELAKKHNFISVSLGQNRLRTETAGVHAASIVSVF